MMDCSLVAWWPRGARDARSYTSSLFSHDSPLLSICAGYLIIQSFMPHHEDLVTLISCLRVVPSGTAAN